MHKQHILILVKTRVHSRCIDKLMCKSNFTSKIAAEATGYSSGIWILWDENSLHLDPVSINEQIVNMLLYQHKKSPWLLSAILCLFPPRSSKGTMGLHFLLGPSYEYTIASIG